MGDRKKVKSSHHRKSNGKQHSSGSSSRKKSSSSSTSSSSKGKDRSKSSNGEKSRPSSSGGTGSSSSNGNHKKVVKKRVETKSSSSKSDNSDPDVMTIGSLTANFGSMKESAKQKYIKGGKYVVLRKLKKLEERYYLSWFENDEKVIDKKIAQKWAAFPHDEKEEDREDQKLKFPWITNLEVGLLKLGDDDKARQRHYVDRLFSLEILKGYKIDKKSLKSKLENRRRALKTLHFSPKYKEIVYIPLHLEVNSREIERRTKAIVDELHAYRFSKELPELKELPDDAKRVEHTLAEHYDFIVDIIMIVHFKLPRCQITNTYKIVHGLFFNISELFVRYVLRRCCSSCRAFIKLNSRNVGGIAENHKDKYSNKWNVYKTPKPYFKVFDDENSDVGNDLEYHPPVSQKAIAYKGSGDKEESDVVEVSDSGSESSDESGSGSGSDSGSESDEVDDAAEEEEEEMINNAGQGSNFKDVSKKIIARNTDVDIMESITINVVDFTDTVAYSDLARKNGNGKWEEIEYPYALHIQERVSRFNFIYPLEDDDGFTIFDLLTFFFKTVFRPKLVVLLHDKKKDIPVMKTKLRDIHVKFIIEEYDSSHKKTDITKFKDYLLLNNGDIIGRDSNLIRKERKKVKRTRMYMHLKTLIKAYMTTKKETNWTNLLPDITNFLNHYTYILGDVRPVDLFLNYANTRLAVPFNGNPTYGFKYWRTSEADFLKYGDRHSDSEDDSDNDSDDESGSGSEDDDGSSSGSGSDNDSDDEGSDNEGSDGSSDDDGSSSGSDSGSGSGSGSGSDSESGSGSGSGSDEDSSSSEEVEEATYRARKRPRRR